MENKGGFTLVEILIVVVILGILAAVVIPQFTDASTEAKTSSLCSDLQTVRSQIELFKIQHNDDLPGAASDTDFADAMTGTSDISGSSTGSDYGPYLQKIPVNPFSDKDTVNTDGTLGDDSHGWEFNTTSGGFYADDSNDHSAL
jgi:general secretion pathway protein G